MQLEQITPLILTYNEADNIDRTLGYLTWAKQIIVIDSFSSDRTLEILEQYDTVCLYQRTFDTHAHQWNYGVEQVQTEWVLSLDADYIVTPELSQELAALDPSDNITGYFIPFKYCVWGHPLRGTILPPRQALFRRDRAHYIDDGHTQLLQGTGESGHLKSYFYHDDRKPLGRWLWAQDRYMIIEARKLLSTPTHELSWGDRLRKQKIIAPFVVLVYCLILRGGILDGWHGWYYAWQRMLAEIVLALQIIEQEKLQRP